MRQSQQKPKAKYNSGPVPLWAPSSTEDCQQIFTSFQQVECQWTLRMRCGALADKFCFDLSGSLETKAKLNRLIWNAGEKMFAHVCTHTQHAAFLLFLILSLHQLPKCQTPAHMGKLPSDNTGFRGKLYKVPLGCSLYCETPALERLFATDPSPFPGHNSPKSHALKQGSRQCWRHQSR